MAESRRVRRMFLGANWKCNGTMAFLREIVTHLINDLEYEQDKLGKYLQPICFFTLSDPISLFF